MQASYAYQYDVYLSYGDRDKKEVHTLADRLAQQGLRVFLDRDLKPGTKWPEALQAALERSRTAAVFFGPTGLGRWQSEEVAALGSLSQSRPVIPVLLPGAEESRLPRLLSDRKWVDFRGGLDDEKAFQDLLRGIQEPDPQVSLAVEAPPPLFDRLSPRARNAVLRADRFRLSRRRARVHMEHLLVGLFDEGDEPVRQAFENAKIDRPRLLEILRKTKKMNLPSPDKPYEPSTATALPPLSGHTEEALNAAQDLADAAGSPTIGSGDLLAGLLSVTQCEVVTTFTEAGLLPPAVPSGAVVPPPEELPEAPPEVSIRIASAGDQPVDKDTLGFEPYVEAVAEFLVNEETRPPLTLSIEGEWGSGKSSFMLQLEKALGARAEPFRSWLRSLPGRLRTAWKGEGAHRWTRLRRELRTPCCLTVRFNAWRHDKEDALWAAFASEFLRRIAHQRFFLRRWLGHLRLFFVRFRWKNGWLEVVRAVAVWGFLIALGIAIPVAAYSTVWTFNLTSWIEKLGTAEDTVKWLVGFGGAGAYIAGFISLFLKAKEVVGNPLEINLRKYLQSPDYDGHVTFVESFHEDFRRIVDAYAGDRKVYVFIDDLDRCEVPKAADLMQALNLLITDDPRLIFLIGMDREKVAAGLAVKYEKLLPYLMPDGVDEKGKIDPRIGLDYGYSFIEKFVQLPFRVPSPKPENLRSFLSTLAGATPRENPPAPALEVRESPSPQPAEPELPVGEPEELPPDQPDHQPEVAETRERLAMLTLKLRGDSPEVEEAALIGAPALENNPRRLKQFVNLFRLRAYIADQIGAFANVTFPQLAKFVAISLAWPGLLTDLAEKNDLLPALQKVALGRQEEPGWAETRPEGRWFRLPALLALLKSGCDVHRDIPLPPDPYNLAHADLDLLLRISPKVVRTQPPTPGPAVPA